MKLTRCYFSLFRLSKFHRKVKFGIPRIKTRILFPKIIRSETNIINHLQFREELQEQRRKKAELIEVNLHFLCFFVHPFQFNYLAKTINFESYQITKQMNISNEIALKNRVPIIDVPIFFDVNYILKNYA